MFSYLGLTSNEDYMAFAQMCADAHEPSGLASGIAGANHMGPNPGVQGSLVVAISLPGSPPGDACAWRGGRRAGGAHRLNRGGGP